jgi:hypothetical protein
LGKYLPHREVVKTGARNQVFFLVFDSVFGVSKTAVFGDAILHCLNPPNSKSATVVLGLKLPLKLVLEFCCCLPKHSLLEAH